MSYELCYTSVPTGLRPGTRGFCTVGLTAGTPAALVEALESLSGYRPLFPAGSPRAAANPVSWSHWRVSAGGQTYSVLSRVCFSGLDYTKRSNKFAHHVALTNREQPPGGPAWVMATGGILRTAWSGTPAEWPSGPVVPDGDSPAGPCHAWAEACGDAGWAGVLAGADAHRSAKPVYVIYPPELDVLPLVREALSLLPPATRWQTTFNTYFTDLPAGSTCAWRFVADGSPAAAEVKRGALIDLTARLPEAPAGPLVSAAREGPSHAAEAASWTLQANADDDDADLMPMAPRGPAFPAARRPAAAPAGHSAPVDPTAWMPPASATVIARQPARGVSASPVKWIAAAAAGAIAASAGWYFAYARSADQVHQLNETVDTLQTQAQTSADDARGARTEIETLKRSHADELTTQVNAARLDGAQHPDAAVWQLIPNSSDPSVKKYTQAEAERMVRDAVAKKPATTGPATTPVATTGESNGLVLHQPLAATPTKIAGTENLCFNLDNVPNVDRDKKASPVPIAVVKDAGPDLQLSLVSGDVVDHGKCFYDPATRKLQRDKKSGEGFEPLGEFVINKGAILLQWPATKPDTNDDQERREFLKRSVLVVTNGQNKEMIQFIEPQSLAVALRDLPTDPLKPPAGGVKRQFVYAGPPDAAWKQISADAAGGAQFALPSGGPAVSFRMDGDRFWSDYADLWTKAVADLAGKTKTRDEQAKDLPKNKTGGVDVDRLSADPQVRGLAERFTAASDAVEAARLQVKNLDQFPPFTAFIRLNSGVVTHKIDIRPGNAKH